MVRSRLMEPRVSFLSLLPSRTTRPSEEWEISGLLEACASLACSLVPDGHTLVGCDFTPRPYLERLTKVCERHGAGFRRTEEAVLYEVRNPGLLVDLAKIADSWTDILIMRTWRVDLADIALPRAARCLGLRRPMEWFDQNVHSAYLTAYLGTRPAPGLEIKAPGLSLGIVLSQLAEPLSKASNLAWTVQMAGGAAQGQEEGA